MADATVLALPLRRFTDAQLVTVIDRASPIWGRDGYVCRLRRADDRAWVRLFDEIPDEVRIFPASDPRGNDVLLAPEQCALGRRR